MVKNLLSVPLKFLISDMVIVTVWSGKIKEKEKHTFASASISACATLLKVVFQLSLCERRSLFCKTPGVAQRESNYDV